MSNLHAVIMAGGSGTRFWPASRAERPKQFLPLAHGTPLLRAAVERVKGICPPERIWIVTNPVQAAVLPKVLPEFGPEQVIVEPSARDTAPCVALALASVRQRDADARMLVLPADQVIGPQDEFERMVQRAAGIAGDDRTLVTFGIEPTFPATGYGYIECGEPIDDARPAARHAVRFREKPVRELAEQFVASGNFLWNSGIFVWTVAAAESAMRQSSPELHDNMQAMTRAIRDGDHEALAQAFGRAPKTSIDFAVMEKAPQVAVVEATVQWDDVGSFPALTAVAPPDDQGNAAMLIDGAQKILCESRDNVVYAEGERTVALFGVEGLVVVALGDPVMVCPKAKADQL